jgi:hypothetical protein
MNKVKICQILFVAQIVKYRVAPFAKCVLATPDIKRGITLLLFQGERFVALLSVTQIEEELLLLQIEFGMLWVVEVVKRTL